MAKEYSTKLYCKWKTIVTKIIYNTTGICDDIRVSKVRANITNVITPVFIGFLTEVPEMCFISLFPSKSKNLFHSLVMLMKYLDLASFQPISPSRAKNVVYFQECLLPRSIWLFYSVSYLFLLFPWNPTHQNCSYPTVKNFGVGFVTNLFSNKKLAMTDPRVLPAAFARTITLLLMQCFFYVQSHIFATWYESTKIWLNSLSKAKGTTFDLTKWG